MITSGVRSTLQAGSVRIPGGRQDRPVAGASSVPGRPSSPWPRVRTRPMVRRVVGTLWRRQEEDNYQ